MRRRHEAIIGNDIDEIDGRRHVRNGSHVIAQEVGFLVEARGLSGRL